MPDIRLILALVVASLLLFIVVPQFLQPAQEVNVSLKEWEIGPNAITVNTGKIKFVVTNDGTVAHGFEIEGMIKGRKFEREIEPFDPGKAKTLVVELPPGEYEVYCPVAGHKEKGMEGTLVVQAPRPY